MKRPMMLVFVLMVIAMPWMVSAGEDVSGSQQQTQAQGSNWINQGWALYNNGHIDRAVQRWTRSVLTLPPEQILLFAGIFHIQEFAVNQLESVGEAHHAIMIEAPYRGSDAFYVLLAAPANKLKTDGDFLKKILNSHSAHGRSASYFQQLHGSMKRVAADSGVLQKDVASIKSTHRPDLQRVPARVTPSTNRLLTAEEHAAIEKLDDFQHLTITAKQPASVDVPRLMTRIQRALSSGDQGKALSLSSYLISLRPANHEARIINARIQVMAGHYDAAAGVLLPLLANKKATDWRPWFWSGTAQLMLGHLEEAASMLNESLARNGSQPAEWVQRSLVEQNRQHYGSALQMLYMADSLQPGNPAVLLNIAWTREAAGDVEQAREAYRAFLTASINNESYINTRLKVIRHLLKNQ